MKIKVQDEWDTFPWATRPKEAHCVTQLHVIPVVACLLLLPLKCCSHYPALYPGSGSLWTSDYWKPQEYSQEVSLQHLLLSPHQLLLALVRAKQREFSPTHSSCVCVLQPGAVFQQGQRAQPVLPLSKAAAFSLPPAASTCFSQNPFSYRFLAWGSDSS